MEAFLHSINAVGLILMMIAVGVFAGKSGIMRSEHKQFIVKYLINIAVPAMCIANVFEQIGGESAAFEFIYFVPPIISMLITLLIALLAARFFKIPKKRYGAFVVMGAFSNSIFMGLPMCKELFGESAVLYVIIFYIINTLMFWTFGTALIQYSANGKEFNLRHSIKKLLTPPLISLFLAVFLVMIGVKLPKIILTFSGYLGDTVSPIALMYVGFIMYETLSKKKQTKEKYKLEFSMVFAMLMRFAVAPVITIVLCKLFVINGLVQKVFVIESAMPVMTQTVIVSAAYGADEQYAASAMTISTVLSLAAIPVIYTLIA
jgi:predicted permease